MRMIQKHTLYIKTQTLFTSSPSVQILHKQMFALQSKVKEQKFIIEDALCNFDPRKVTLNGGTVK